MRHISKTWATIVTAALALPTGLGVSLHGVLRSDTAHALGGLSLTVIGLALIALLCLHRWITDTSAERRDLATRQRQAEDTHSRYVALQASLECEQTRFMRDLAAERAALVKTLATEREALHTELHAQRGEISRQAFEDAFLMIAQGRIRPGGGKGTLIPFPQPERERARGNAFAAPGTPARSRTPE